MTRTALRFEVSNELQEPDYTSELKVLLDQVRQDYDKNKSEERRTKAKRKRHLLIGSSSIFFVLTGLLMILKFTGLLQS